jgi:apolipoprotein N-acyltransferase
MSIAPYGYTLTVWTSGAVLAHARGIPSTADALLFMVGAVGGFALVGLASFGTLTARVHVEAQQPALWGGFHVLSIAVAIGSATLIAHLLEDRVAWPSAVSPPRRAIWSFSRLSSRSRADRLCVIHCRAHAEGGNRTHTGPGPTGF